MNNNCEFSEGGYCMCNICQTVQKAMEDAGKVTQEEVDKLFLDAETLLEDIKTPEKEGEKNGTSKD